MQLSTTPNTTALLDNKEHLFFSGTSYLGVSMLPEFQEIVFDSIKKWGISYGSSPNANLKLEIYKKGETFIRNFLHTESALTVSSGTLASQLALNTLQDIADRFYAMPKIHPSILPNKATNVYENRHLNKELVSIENTNICIISDAIAALETTPYSFDFLTQIPKSNTVYLLIDESHSLGVLGKNGNGISQQISSQKNVKIIIVSSLGKAFGVNGGIIAGNTNFIKKVKEKPLFIGAAGMCPSFLETFINAQEIYQSQREKLQKVITYVYAKLATVKDIHITNNYPVFFLSDDKIADDLLKKNIVITSFFYPATPQKINRVVLNANHTKKQLDQLIKSFMVAQ